jgi:Tyrosine phosphatase family
VLLGDNFHTLIPGRVFRCAQRTGPELEQLIQRYNIRTVINLRGCCAPWPWYLDECRATFHQNISQEDICFSAGRLPSVSEVRRLVEVLERTEYPAALHCRRGSDRTGLASAIVLLLQTDSDLEHAWRQLGLRYGHVAIGRPACLHRFFQLYRDWLASKDLTHSPARFRHWLKHEYCPGSCRSRVEPLDLPATIPVAKPFALRFRMTNTSLETWRLQPETNAGFHARFVLWNDDDQQLAAPRAGLFREEVPPGGTIDLTLAFPALKSPGRYRVMVDMVDERQCWFFQTGSQPWEMELEARE